jgi:hypothetical protein
MGKAVFPDNKKEPLFCNRWKDPLQDSKPRQVPCNSFYKDWYKKEVNTQEPDDVRPENPELYDYHKVCILSEQDVCINNPNTPEIYFNTNLQTCTGVEFMTPDSVINDPCSVSTTDGTEYPGTVGYAITIPEVCKNLTTWDEVDNTKYESSKPVLYNDSCPFNSIPGRDYILSKKSKKSYQDHADGEVVKVFPPDGCYIQNYGVYPSCETQQGFSNNIVNSITTINNTFQANDANTDNNINVNGCVKIIISDTNIDEDFIYEGNMAVKMTTITDMSTKLDYDFFANIHVIIQNEIDIMREVSMTGCKDQLPGPTVDIPTKDEISTIFENMIVNDTYLSNCVDVVNNMVVNNCLVIYIKNSNVGGSVTINNEQAYEIYTANSIQAVTNLAIKFDAVYDIAQSFSEKKTTRYDASTGEVASYFALTTICVIIVILLAAGISFLVTKSKYSKKIINAKKKKVSKSKKSKKK